MCIYIYIHTHIRTYIYIYIYGSPASQDLPFCFQNVFVSLFSVVFIYFPLGF